MIPVLFFLVYIKVDQENIIFLENYNKSYTMVDLYLNDRFLGYKDSYYYYDIDVDKILLFKKSDNEYIIRYNDVNKMIIAPLQLKIKNFYNELNTFENNNRLIDKSINNRFIRINSIILWNKIIELIAINNTIDFVNADDDDDEFIMTDVYKITSFVIKNSYRCGHNKVVIVLHSVIIDYLKTSFVQHILIQIKNTN